MSAERRQFEVADDLGGGGAGLRELPGHAADLHDGNADGVGEHDGHLQDDAQLLSNVVGGELIEALGAIAGLEQEGPPGGHTGEFGLQRPGLAGEHQRRKGRELRLDIGQCLGIGIGGHLQHRLAAPAIGRPALGHVVNS